MASNTITAESLKEDNHSHPVVDYLESWQENLNEQNITFVLGCSDPRLLIARHATADIRSIGAAALPELYSSILNKKVNPRAIIVVVHHDGETVKPGEMPKGCGGLSVRATLSTNDYTKRGYSAKYVGEHIAHQDPFIQGVFTGEEIAELSKCPVLVVTEDHRTGQIYPLTSFLPRQSHDLLIRSSISLRSGFEGRYNPKKIYSSGIPQIASDQIPSEFTVFMKRHELFVKSVKNRIPSLYLDQKIINPSVVALTTEIRPIQSRFPNLLGKKPNTVFTVTIQRQTRKIKEDYDVNIESMNRALDQVHYAFSHALENKGNPELGFSRLYNHGTMLIEGDIASQLDQIAKAALATPYIQEWIKIKGNKIITLETSKGRVQKAKELKI